MKHKVTFLFENGFASETYTSSPPAGGAVSLRLGQARFSVSTGDRFIAAPLLRSPRGEAKDSVRGRMFNSPRFDLSALCGLYPILPLIPHAVVVALPSAGVKGASPLQLFLFEFFFLRRKKNGEALTQSGNICRQIKTNIP